MRSTFSLEKRCYHILMKIKFNSKKVSLYDIFQKYFFHNFLFVCLKPKGKIDIFFTQSGGFWSQVEKSTKSGTIIRKEKHCFGACKNIEYGINSHKIQIQAFNFLSAENKKSFKNFLLEDIF